MSVDVTGAEVYVDGAWKGTASPRLALNLKGLAAGVAKVRVEAPGCEPREQSLEILPGQWAQVRMVMTRTLPRPPAPPAREGADLRVDLGRGQVMTLVQIPAGTLAQAGLAHPVTLSHGFWLGRSDVTVGQFRRFVEETGYRTQAETGDGAIVWTGAWQTKADASWRHPYLSQGEDRPVVCVSWEDVQAFVRWLNRKGAGTFRLPTEAEWELACQTGSTLERCENLDGIDQVWQWCQDWFGEEGPERDTDPQGPPTGSARVVRGAGWSALAPGAGSALRVGFLPKARLACLGFRLVRTLP